MRKTVLRTCSEPVGDWWRNKVIYHIYPRSFFDGNGDGIGDIAGITQKLKYVADLGVDAILLSAFFPSAMRDTGYDVTEYCDVDPDYGSLEDFDRLIERAHALNLRVIIDQVPCHTSDKHPWFCDSRQSKQSDKSDWYIWADPHITGGPPNNWLSAFGGSAWEWDQTREQYYLHHFLAEQPSLNFHNSDVQQACLDNMRFWLQRGVDGLRVDTVNYLYHDADLTNNPADPTVTQLYGRDPARVGGGQHSRQKQIYSKSRPQTIEFLKRVRALHDEFDGRVLLGQVDDDAAVDLANAYTDINQHLDMCHIYDLFGDEFSATHFLRQIERHRDVAQTGRMYWSFSCPDIVRHVTRWNELGIDYDRFAMFCATLLLSLPGAICLYQGEELGLPEADIPFDALVDPVGKKFWPTFKGRDGCRVPLVWSGSEAHGGFSTKAPWLPIPDGHGRHAIDRQANEDSVLTHYRRMLAFRRAHPVITAGVITWAETCGNVLIQHRELGAERMLLMFNFDDAPVNQLLPENIGVATPVPLPGYPALLHEGTVIMNELDVFCAVLT